MRPISAMLLLGLGFCSFAYAQINTDAGATIPGTGIDTSRLPPALSLVDVGDPEVSFYQAPGVVNVMVEFEASVQNSGGNSGEYLIIATATGGTASTTSKKHNIYPGQIQHSSEVLKSELNRFGANRFAVTVS